MPNIIDKIELPKGIEGSHSISKFELSRIQMTTTYLKREYVRNDFFTINKFENVSYSTVKNFVSENKIEIAPIQKKRINKNTSDAIIDVIFNKDFNVGGKKCFGYNLWADYLRNKIQQKVKNKESISIIFPGFPFKIKNRLKTPSGNFDSSELFGLVCLKKFLNEIESIYEFGCEIVILLDGFVYNRVFGINREEVVKYQEQLFEHLKILDINGKIKAIDLNRILIPNDEFSFMIKSCNIEMINYWEKNYYSEKIQGLIINSMANINLWNHDIEIYKTLFANKNFKNNTDEINRILIESKKSAFVYMTIQLAIERFNLYERKFNDSIRFTVHPKTKQIGIKLTRKNNYLLPWMSCGVIQNNKSTCRYFCELSPLKYKAVYIDGFSYPYSFVHIN